MRLFIIYCLLGFLYSLKRKRRTGEFCKDYCKTESGVCSPNESILEHDPMFSSINSVKGKVSESAFEEVKKAIQSESPFVEDCKTCCEAATCNFIEKEFKNGGKCSLYDLGAKAIEWIKGFTKSAFCEDESISKIIDEKEKKDMEEFCKSLERKARNHFG